MAVTYKFRFLVFSDSHKLLIIDARDYTAAQFNRFRGGGFEFGEYYDQSQIRFMNLPNLHYVRKSFEALIALYRNPDSRLVLPFHFATFRFNRKASHIFSSKCTTYGFS